MESKIVQADLCSLLILTVERWTVIKYNIYAEATCSKANSKYKSYIMSLN